MIYFNPRSPHGERRVFLRCAPQLLYFNPRSPHGERHDLPDAFKCAALFQSTLPARGATNVITPAADDFCISIHAPRTGSDGAGLPNQPGHDISIHAPRTGSDVYDSVALCKHLHISIHAPRTGSDNVMTRISLKSAQFQSTLPARGATRCFARPPRNPSDFNPRSPHGERRFSVPCGARI